MLNTKQAENMQQYVNRKYNEITADYGEGFWQFEANSNKLELLGSGKEGHAVYNGTTYATYTDVEGCVTLRDIHTNTILEVFSNEESGYLGYAYKVLMQGSI